MSKWIKPAADATNLILDAPDESFFISYNPKAGDADMADTLGELAELFSAILGEDKEFKNREEETALVKRNPNGLNTYSILKGDFRKQYEHLMPEGYKACLKFFDQHQEEYGSNWSTPR